jgi:hypothetical protein
MGDPVTLAIIGTALTAGMGAYSSIQQGNAQASAAEFERAQYEEQRTLGKIQALDEEADRRRRLNQVLASNQAAAAGMGINTNGSRSFLAIQDDSANEAERDIGRISLNAASQNRRFSLAADQASMSGKAARRAGYIGAGTSLLQGGTNMATLSK